MKCVCIMNLRQYLLKAQGLNVHHSQKLNKKQAEKLPLPQRLINDIVVFDSAEPSPLVASGYVKIVLRNPHLNVMVCEHIIKFSDFIPTSK